MNEPVYTVVLGAGGYVGGELLRLIATHPKLELAAAVSDNRSGQPIGDTFAHLSQVLAEAAFVGSDAWPDTIPAGSNVALFSAAPHGASAGIIAAALDAAEKKNFRIHVVDCSADFRYRDQAEWESVYGLPHGARRTCCSNSAARYLSTWLPPTHRMSVIPAASPQRFCWPAFRSYSPD